MVVGDHGEAFGELGHFQHGSCLHADCLRVPLFFHDPFRDGALSRPAPTHADALRHRARELMLLGRPIKAAGLRRAATAAAAMTRLNWTSEMARFHLSGMGESDESERGGGRVRWIEG